MVCPICRKGEDENHQLCVMKSLHENTQQLTELTKTLNGIYNLLCNRVPRPDRGGFGGGRGRY